jgi:hypothetical protein
MKNKWLLLCGVFASLVYVGTVVIGGLLRAGYSHIADPISELTASGAPNKALLDILFLAYNLLVIAFGVGIQRAASSLSHSKISGYVTSAALIATGLSGVLLQFFFPQDPGGAQAAVTTTGSLHIAFAGLAALTSMVALLAAALWFRKQSDLKTHVPYTLVTFVVMLVSGGFGAGAALNDFPLFGVIERITIGSLIVWLFVVGRRLYIDATQGEHTPKMTSTLRGAAGR